MNGINRPFISFCHLILEWNGEIREEEEIVTVTVTVTKIESIYFIQLNSIQSNSMIYLIEYN